MFCTAILLVCPIERKPATSLIASSDRICSNNVIVSVHMYGNGAEGFDAAIAGVGEIASLSFAISIHIYQLLVIYVYISLYLFIN